MFRDYFYFITFIFAVLASCSAHKKQDLLTIGIDKNWYPVDFGNQVVYVNGFVEELLLEMTTISSLEFEKSSESWDSLFDGLRKGKTQAVLSSLSPYNFNLAEYDFSTSFLDFGPVLVSLIGNSYLDLASLNGHRVGLVQESPFLLVLESYQEVTVSQYPSASEMLNAVLGGEIDAALLDQITAAGYVNDSFSGLLKIASSCLDDTGLRLITLKGEQERLMQQFNQAISLLKKKKKLQALLRKWQLDSDV